MNNVGIGVGSEVAPVVTTPPARPHARRPAGRSALAVPAVLALLLGLAGGLALLGVWSPPRGELVAEAHGVLMVLGFVGALIALERAVALATGADRTGRLLGYLAPAALSVGALLHLHGSTARTGSGLLLLGCVVLVAVYVALWRRQREDAVLVEALGAVLALGATVLLRGGLPVGEVLPWLGGFLVLTIVGERLELAALGMRRAAAPLLLGPAAVFAVAVMSTLLWPDVGSALLGATLAGLGVWLVRYDVARHTVHARGLTRYMAVGMLAGQAWLLVTAAVWLVAGPVSSGPAYDALVHALFLGFTMSMVMAHAPVILPAVTRLGLEFHPVAYLPLALLQGSLLVRVWLGDGLGSDLARQTGGVLNAAALLLFLATTAWSAWRGRQRR